MPDIFICHATEDKQEVARPLATALRNAGLDVWYDEYSLKLGDSLRESIDNGLAQSQYGVVIISPSFFAKKWPQAELNGLFAKEMAGQKMILPIWHNVDHVTVLDHSLILADRVAAKTNEGLDTVAYRILEVVKPNNHYLILSGKTLTVTPARIRLHTGEWAVKTPLRITNQSDSPAYSVQVKLTLDPPDLDSMSITIELDRPTTSIEETFSDIKLSADAFIHYFLDLSDHECLAIVLHTVDPHATREIQVFGTNPIPSTAEVQVWDFKESPAEMLRKGNHISFPLTVPEIVKSRGTALLISKK